MDAPNPRGGPGRLLRGVAALIVRGPHAPYVLGDLDESYRRDVARGVPVHRARRRYAMNALSSAFTLARERLHRMRIDGIRARLPSSRLPALGFSWLDVKLGVRMLVKYPGLTGVAVFALALGIPASLAPVHLLGMLDVALPFDEGERIVGLRHRYVTEREEAPGTLHAYAVWRVTLSSFARIGAARSERYNVIAEDGMARPYRGARLSASSFAIVRVPPLLGRPLLEADEVPGAPDVVVIGYDLWQSVFNADPDALGRTLRIGGVPHTVVGVMPEGFLFPERDHLWLPLRASALAYEPGTGPELWIYGRLADGATPEQALAEMTVVHRGLADAYPDVYDRLRPEIVPYTYLATSNPTQLKWILAPFQLLALVLLAVACGNVGTLVLARTAARSGEVAVRTALGASRARIVSQLFVESLVLALLATGVGLVLVEILADWIGNPRGTPFWFDLGPTRTTVVQALALAVFSAAIAGVVPALKATGTGIRSSLQKAASGRSAIRFGHGTTVLIVLEVALGVVCLFGGGIGYLMAREEGPAGMTIRADRFLSARLTLPASALPTASGELDPQAFRERVALLQRELVRRLEAEPGVRGVAIAGTLPRQSHAVRRIEVEGDVGPVTAGGRPVLRARVDVAYFEGLGQPVLRGRDFTASDVADRGDDGGRVVIANTSFVERVLRGRNPIGRRIRFLARDGGEPGPWYEIVGVVPSLGMVDYYGLPDDAGLYLPAAPGALYPIRFAIGVSGDPRAFATRLRDIAGDVDPAVMVDELVRLDEHVPEERRIVGSLILAFGAVAAIAVVLSIAGLYALMSFTVAQRTHEIGIRTALGANAAGIVSVIVRRAVVQLGVGVLLGAVAGLVILHRMMPNDSAYLNWPAALAGAVVGVVAIGSVACIAPTLRGLRIRPMDALRV